MNESRKDIEEIYIQALEEVDNQLMDGLQELREAVRHYETNLEDEQDNWMEVLFDAEEMDNISAKGGSNELTDVAVDHVDVFGRFISASMRHPELKALLEDLIYRIEHLETLPSVCEYSEGACSKSTKGWGVEALIT